MTRLVGLSVCHYFLKGREVTLPCSHQSTCFLIGPMNNMGVLSCVRTLFSNSGQVFIRPICNLAASRRRRHLSQRR